MSRTKKSGHNPELDLKSKVSLRTMRDYFRFLRPEAFRMIFLLLITVSMALVPLLNPLIFRQIVDVAIPSQDIGALLRLSLLSLGVVGASIALTYTKEIVSSRLLQRQVERLRLLIYDSYCKRSIDSIFAVPSGEPLSLVSHGAPEAASLTTSVAPRILQTATVVVGAGGILWSSGVPLWLLAPMLGIVPLVMLAQYAARRIEHLMSESIDALGSIGAHMGEITLPSGALVYRSGTDRTYDRRRFMQKTSTYAQKVNKQTRWHSSFGAVVGAYGGLAISLLFFTGGYLATQGEMSTGDVVALATIAPMVISPLIGSSGIRTEAAKALMSFARIMDTGSNSLKHTIPLEDRENAHHLPPTQGIGNESVVLHADITSKRYHNSDRDSVLNGVTLTVLEGETVAVLGESGVGKSTLLKILAGIDIEFTGKAEIRGVGTSAIDDHMRKRTVMYVPQETVLSRDSLLENFRLFKPEITTSEVWEALEQVGLSTVVSRMSAGLDTVLGSEQGGLSGGQIARVGLARAIATAPEVIILDEPFAHIDKKMGERILNVILKRIKTVILVTHQTEYAQGFKRQILLERGQIEELTYVG